MDTNNQENLKINEIQEFLEEIKLSGGNKVDDIRNVNFSKKNYGSSLGFFKKEPGRKALVFVPKTMTFLFNPFIGEEDEKYNEENPYLVGDNVGKFIQALKYYFGQEGNEVFFKKFKMRLKIKNWDISDATTVTQDDIEAFASVTRPHENYVDVVKVNCKAVSDNSVNFRVDIRRGEDGALLDEFVNSDGKVVKVPNYTKTFLSIAELHSIKANNIYNKWLEGEGANKSDDDKKTQRSVFNSSEPAGVDIKQVEYIGFAFNYENLQTITSVFDSGADVMKKSIFRGRVNKDFTARINDIQETGSGLNVHPDFYIIDFTVSKTPEQQKFRGKDVFKLSMGKPDSKVLEHAKLTDFLLKLSEHISTLDLVKIYKASLAKSLPLLTESTVEKVIEFISENNDISDYGLTEAQVNFFAPVIGLLYPNSAIQAVMEAKEDDVNTADVKGTLEGVRLFQNLTQNAEEETNEENNVDVNEIEEI